MSSKKEIRSVFRNVTIIEPAVKDDIKLLLFNLVCEPVPSLDDLLDWEERLSEIGKDYLIAEFNYDVEVANIGDECYAQGKSVGKKVNKRVFGIFASVEDMRNPEDKIWKEPEDEFRFEDHEAIFDKKQTQFDGYMEDFIQIKYGR